MRRLAAATSTAHPYRQRGRAARFEDDIGRSDDLTAKCRGGCVKDESACELHGGNYPAFGMPAARLDQ